MVRALRARDGMASKTTVAAYDSTVDRLHDENRRGESLADTLERLLAELDHKQESDETEVASA